MGQALCLSGFLTFKEMKEGTGRNVCLFLSGIFRADEGKELVAGLLVVTETAKHGAGHRLAMLLFDAAHLHAKMTRLNDHADTFGADLFLNSRSDLTRQALLNLQTPREHVDKTRDFAEADDALVGKIRHVALAKKRQQVVFAEAEELDVFHNHHFVIGNAKRGAIEDVLRVLVVAAGQKFQRLFITFRRLAQAFAIGVFADQFDNFADVAGNSARIQLFLFVQNDFFRWFSHHFYLSKPSGLSPAYSKLLFDVS